MIAVQEKRAEALAQARRALIEVLDPEAERRRRLLQAMQRWGVAPPTGEFEIVDGVVNDRTDHATFLLEDSGDPVGSRWPYKAFLRRLDGKRRRRWVVHKTTGQIVRSTYSNEAFWVGLTHGWGVTSIVAQCASCFGSGVLEGYESGLCRTCAGQGWGLADETGAERD